MATRYPGESEPRESLYNDALGTVSAAGRIRNIHGARHGSSGQRLAANDVSVFVADFSGS